MCERHLQQPQVPSIKDRSNKFIGLAVRRGKQVETWIQYACYTQCARCVLSKNAAGTLCILRVTDVLCFIWHTTPSTHDTCNMPGRAFFPSFFLLIIRSGSMTQSRSAISMTVCVTSIGRRFPPPSLHVCRHLELGIHLKISDVWISFQSLDHMISSTKEMEVGTSKP
jgi:hypothetical protein